MIIAVQSHEVREEQLQVALQHSCQTTSLEGDDDCAQWAAHRKPPPEAFSLGFDHAEILGLAGTPQTVLAETSLSGTELAANPTNEMVRRLIILRERVDCGGTDKEDH